MSSPERPAGTGCRPSSLALVLAIGAALAGGCNDRSPSSPISPTPTPPPPPAASVASLTAAPDAVLAGLDVTATITLAAAAPAGGVSVALTGSHASAIVPASASVPAGATAVTVTISTRDVAAPTRVTVTASVGSSSQQAEFEIQPVHRQAAGFAIEPASIRGGETATGRVSLGTFAMAAAPHALDDIVITLTSSHSSVQVPASVTIPAGQTEATFPIVTIAVPQTVAVTLTASAGGETRTTGMRVLPAGPALASLSPASGAAGTSVVVTLTGSGFVAGDTTVTVGGAALVSVSNVVVVSETALTATFAIHATANAGAYPVTVATSGGISEARTFTVTAVTGAPPGPAPTLATVTANSGSASGGRGVTLTGTSLGGTTGVTFGGVAATSVNVVNSTTVTAVTPAHAVGAVDVVLTSPGGSATLTNGFTYVATAVGQSAYGGVIAGLNGGLQNLIATTAENSGGVEWGGFGTVTNAQSDADGGANTTTIVNGLGNNGGIPYAAQVCSEYEVDSQGNTPCQAGNTCYDDWFLPARDQLNLMYTNRVAIGGFNIVPYATSTEDTGDPSVRYWLQSFLDGTTSTGLKDAHGRVRCVRAFTP
jgi:hypothetical protein